jgi:hypothetical protein
MLQGQAKMCRADCLKSRETYLQLVAAKNGHPTPRRRAA